MREEEMTGDEFIKQRNACAFGFLVAVQNMKRLINGTSKSRTLWYLNDWYSNVEKGFKDDPLWDMARDAGALSRLLDNPLGDEK